MIEIAPLFLGLVPVTIGVVQLLKGYFKKRLSPLVTLVVAEVLTILAVYALGNEVNIPDALLQGVLVALTSAGLYAGSKTLIKG